MLEAGVLIIGVVYVVATLIADLLLTGSTRGCGSEEPVSEPGRRSAGRDVRRVARGRPAGGRGGAPGHAGPWRLLLRRPTF